MKNKVLIVTSVASMIDQFILPDIILLQEIGYEVHVATNFIEPGSIPPERANKLKSKLSKLNVVYYNVNFSRNPFNIFKTLNTYNEIKKIISNNNYVIVHSHSPIGGALTRIAAKRYKKKNLYSVYTAHGFHFYKGASFLSWLLFYPIEKRLSKYTDILITINNEDFDLAKRKFHMKKLKKIPGIGLNPNKNFCLSEEDKKIIRNAYGISNDEIVLISVGELNDNKNHITVLKSLKNLTTKYGLKNIKYFIFGQGPNETDLNKYINKNNLENIVFLKGYVENINHMLNMGDIFLFPSKREGLGMAALEAMSAGLPIITSNVHGIKDYSQNGVTGYTCSTNDVQCYSEAILNLYKNKNNRTIFGKNNIIKVQDFTKDKVNKIMKEIYQELKKEDEN